MLTYKIDVLETLKSAKYSTFQLRKHKILNESAIQSLRNGKMVGIKSIDTICRLTGLQPGDLLQYEDDIEEK